MNLRTAEAQVPRIVRPESAPYSSRASSRQAKAHRPARAGALKPFELGTIRDTDKITSRDSSKVTCSLGLSSAGIANNLLLLFLRETRSVTGKSPGMCFAAV